MELTEEQIKFLDKVCYGRVYWALNENGKVDVGGDVKMNDMNLTEIPVKFGRVDGNFDCSNNNLKTLKNCPDYVGGDFRCNFNKLTSLEFYPTSIDGKFDCYKNNLTNYFKNLKEEDFPHWDKLYWIYIIDEYPFLVNISKGGCCNINISYLLNRYPQTKLYLE